VVVVEKQGVCEIKPINSAKNIWGNRIAPEDQEGFWAILFRDQSSHAEW